MKKVEFLLPDTYIETIKKSVGTKMFQNIYALVDGEKTDVAQGGVYSCANYASSILVMFDLIEKRHATVKSTVKDIKNSGWKKIEKPKKGAVIIWEPWKKSDRNHIGFYVEDNVAISTESDKGGVPHRHHWTYNENRPVKSIWWHKKLEN